MMLLPALLEPFSLLVLVSVSVFFGVSVYWLRRARSQADALFGGLSILERLVSQLPTTHPIRRRLESSPITDLALEELSALLRGTPIEAAIRDVARMSERAAWIDRFAQFAIHLGILGTVFALLRSDPTDLQGFRASLPTALGTTFWGLVGALALSGVAGAGESLLESATRRVREASILGFSRTEDDAPP